MKPIDVCIQTFFIGLITEMGCIFLKLMKELSNIEVLDYTPQGPEFVYLRLTGIITVKMDDKWKASVIHFDLDGWTSTFIRPSNPQTENFLILLKTPLPSPISSSDYGHSCFDTVF